MKKYACLCINKGYIYDDRQRHTDGQPKLKREIENLPVSLWCKRCDSPTPSPLVFTEKNDFHANAEYQKQ